MLQAARILTIMIALIATAVTAGAQDVTSYTIRGGEEDVFEREVAAARARTTLDASLPGLGCTVEYIRRLGGEEIVYRRGPIDLHVTQQPDISDRQERGTRPASEDDRLTPHFYGGILVDLPRPGESAQPVPMLPERYRYMLRLALVPQHYEDATLHAVILLERAVVEEDGDELTLHRGELFTRSVELNGNLPLKFDLPEWDSRLPNGVHAVPPNLREGVLVTLETPHAFSLPGSYPDPFRSAALLTYAVPRTSSVRLTITVAGEERVIDQGRRQPGTYEVVWDAESLPDDSYTAVLTATNDEGARLFRTERTLVKSRNAEPFRPEQFSMFRRDISGHVVIGTESGIGFQIPVDDSKALRNMFTHIAFRVGYRLSPSWEIGVLAGQDAFHESPGSEVDVDRISNYGGVVAYTYGYLGPYLRWMPGHAFLQPVLQVSAAWSDAAMVAETAVGLKAEIFRNVELYAAPAAFFHLRSSVSTKLGIHYGLTMRF